MKKVTKKVVKGWIALDHKGNPRREHFYFQKIKPKIVADCSCNLPVVKCEIHYSPKQ